MIRGLINYCNLDPDATILDPFCGSGTSLIEANLLGFNSIGIDINPIACLNSKIKTELLDCNIDNLLKDNKKYFNLTFFDDFIIDLTDFKQILDIEQKDRFYLFIFLRALAYEKRFSIDKEMSFKRIYLKLINILKLYENLKKKISIDLGYSKIFFNNCLLELKNIRKHSIDAIITSPPYIDLIDYIREDLISINQLFNKEEIELMKNKSIGNKFENSILTEKLYWSKINLFLKESVRLLKPNKNFILIINNYKNMKAKYEKFIFANNLIIERVLRRNVINIKKKNNIEFVYFLKSKI